MALLEATQISVAFGGLVAVDHVDVAAEAGRVTGVIGPNGAGKTTLFNVMCGLQRPDSGSVRLDDEDITGLSPPARSRRGLARTFQLLELFDVLTTRENILVAAEANRSRGREVDTEVDAIIDLVGLADIADTRVDELSTGRARLVELARALATRPKVMLLDEPAAGLNDAETSTLAVLLGTLAADGRAIVLVEHDIGLVMNVCDHIYVLDRGQVLAAGGPTAIRANSDVIMAYLGTSPT